MSANQQTMATMLASALGGQQQGQTPAQNSGSLGFAAQLAQKLMMMQSLQNQKPGAPPPVMQPGMPQPQTPAPTQTPGVPNGY